LIIIHYFTVIIIIIFVSHLRNSYRGLKKIFKKIIIIQTTIYSHYTGQPVVVDYLGL